jgi:methionyl-tRNA formyltransferase
MLAFERIAIADDDTTGTLHDRLAALGARMIVGVLPRLRDGELKAMPQPEEGVTYAAKIAKEEAVLDFSLSAQEIARRVRAFNPFPGAVASFDGVALKIWRAEALATSTPAPPGTLLAANAASGVLVACGEGVIRLMELQKSGGKRLAAGEFLKGFPMNEGRFSPLRPVFVNR